MDFELIRDLYSLDDEGCDDITGLITVEKLQEKLLERAKKKVFDDNYSDFFEFFERYRKRRVFYEVYPPVPKKEIKPGKKWMFQAKRNMQNILRPKPENLTPVPALLRAARNRDPKAIQQVLNTMSSCDTVALDVNVTDGNGRTALSYLSSTRYILLIDVLTSIPNVDLAKADTVGNTPLHYAAKYGTLNTIKLLIAKGNNTLITLENRYGLTPMMVATERGRFKCAKYLLLKGTQDCVVNGSS